MPKGEQRGPQRARARHRCRGTDGGDDAGLAHRHGRRCRPRGAPPSLVPTGSSVSVNARKTPFLVLTNNSIYTRRDLSARLLHSGLEVPEESIWTSANATGRFLESQRPGGSAYVIGEAGLTTALDTAPAMCRPSVIRTTSFLARPHLQLRTDHHGGPPHRRRCPLHRDEPRPHRTQPPLTAARHRVGGGAHQQGHRGVPLLRRQAESPHDPHRSQHPRRPFGIDHHDRRPHGHRCGRRARGRSAHDPCLVWRVQRRRRAPPPVPALAGVVSSVADLAAELQ